MIILLCFQVWYIVLYVFAVHVCLFLATEISSLLGFQNSRPIQSSFSRGRCQIYKGWSCLNKYPVPASVAQLDACLTGDQEIVDSLMTHKSWRVVKSQHNQPSFNRSLPGMATFFCWDWSWNIFYSHSFPSAVSRRAGVHEYVWAMAPDTVRGY